VTSNAPTTSTSDPSSQGAAAPSVDRGAPIRLYEGVAPGSETWTQEERSFYSEAFGTEAVTNVVVPTLTPVLPETCNGTAVVIAPGGGYHALSINAEGFHVADWLAARGVAAFVLAYRLLPSGADGTVEMFEKLAADPVAARLEMEAVAPLAVADGEMAMRLVRARADEFGVDPARVGIIGFSAGGNVAMRVAFTDDPSARPDFVAPIYAAVRGYDLATVPSGSGPLFAVAAADDELGLAPDSVRIYEAWRAAGLAAELHMYATGGHGFGMKTQGLPSDTWIERFGDWLAALGLI
jgi:acetyl esterase/lipase